MSRITQHTPQILPKEISRNTKHNNESYKIIQSRKDQIKETRIIVPFQNSVKEKITQLPVKDTDTNSPEEISEEQETLSTVVPSKSLPTKPVDVPQSENNTVTSSAKVLTKTKKSIESLQSIATAILESLNKKNDFSQFIDFGNELMKNYFENEKRKIILDEQRLKFEVAKYKFENKGFDFDV